MADYEITASEKSGSTEEPVEAVGVPGTHRDVVDIHSSDEETEHELDLSISVDEDQERSILSDPEDKTNTPLPQLHCMTIEEDAEPESAHGKEEEVMNDDAKKNETKGAGDSEAPAEEKNRRLLRFG